MSRLIVFMSMSVDGYIAAAGDGPGLGLGVGGDSLHAWLAGATPEHDGSGPADGPDAEVLGEMLSTGAVIAGRRAFEHVAGWHGDHHDGVPILVLTRSPEAHEPFGHARFVGDPATAAAEAKAAAGDRDVMMHGGTAVQAFLAAGLVDELAITLAPTLLGDGRRLFETGLPHEQGLTLVRAQQGRGALHLRYRVDR